MSAPAPTLEDAIQAALATVDDPEIRRPITELGMVKGFTVGDGLVKVELLLTVAGCPLRDKLTDGHHRRASPRSPASPRWTSTSA